MSRKSEKKTEPAKKPRTKKVGEYVELLPVPLSDRELLEFGQRLAKCQADINEHNAHAEQVKKDLKAKESAIEAERARLAGIVREKKEPRDVRVERIAHFDESEVVDIRMDSGEIINRRPIQPHERQEKLPIPDGAVKVTAAYKRGADAQDIASSHAPGRGGAAVGTSEMSNEEEASLLSHHPDEPPHEITR